MDPYQTAPWEQSDLGPCCLQYRRPKNKSRQEEQTTTRGADDNISLMASFLDDTIKLG